MNTAFNKIFNTIYYVGNDWDNKSLASNGTWVDYKSAHNDYNSAALAANKYLEENPDDLGHVSVQEFVTEWED